MAPKYKLTYFDVRARGEPTRLLFAAAGVEYEDVRITFDQWPAHKDSTPMGVLPILEVDGITLSQSMSIARFIARETGLDGKTRLERAQADAFVDELEELIPKMAGVVVFAKDEKDKEEKSKELDKLIAERLGKCEKLSGSDGHLVGNSLLWCDLVLFNIAHNIEEVYKAGTMQDYPKLTKVCDTVKANPRIAKWMAERPAGMFDF
ncbi:hematopoietic prostaglandin D synthase-like [Branchiostoma floridae]|uniref:glutathione transferase n=1 Tax=Branchiostoma floridae TaxID=7739 RepID=A0A9J7KUW5_BRAFL|nr:hematopoietic prostaglandin D synthase-like [Branchiostoma floridae]